MKNVYIDILFSTIGTFGFLIKKLLPFLAKKYSPEINTLLKSN
jgi:hypothetical protein